MTENELRVVSRWLDMMKQLVPEIYTDLGAVHDQPIDKLLTEVMISAVNK